MWLGLRRLCRRILHTEVISGRTLEGRPRRYGSISRACNNETIHRRLGNLKQLLTRVTSCYVLLQSVPSLCSHCRSFVPVVADMMGLLSTLSQAAAPKETKE